MHCFEVLNWLAWFEIVLMFRRKIWVKRATLQLFNQLHLKPAVARHNSWSSPLSTFPLLPHRHCQPATAAQSQLTSVVLSEHYAVVSRITYTAMTWPYAWCQGLFALQHQVPGGDGTEKSRELLPHWQLLASRCCWLMLMLMPELLRQIRKSRIIQKGMEGSLRKKQAPIPAWNFLFF